MSWLRRAREFLVSRKTAYQRVFNEESFDTDIVLMDLAKFCRANKSTAHENSHVAARLDGRREVFLRISQHLKLSTDQLWALYGGSSQEKGDK